MADAKVRAARGACVWFLTVSICGLTSTALPALRASAAAREGTPSSVAMDTPVYAHREAPLDARVADLLRRLTLAEKISLMSGGGAFSTAPVPRLGIPAIRFSDGTNGVRSNDGKSATVFPTESAIGATWNPAIARAVGESVGREARAMDVQVMLGPDLNLQRLPTGGRDFEMYSEDPYLTGVMGAAYVQGLQREGVGATIKHYVGNEQELERMRMSSNIDERTLHELYLAPFRMIVRSTDPWAVMVSYNRLNGIYMTENSALVHRVLEGEWGYKGLVISDWGAVHSTIAAANSGLDLEMPGPPTHFGGRLSAAVKNGRVNEAVIDEAVSRVLRIVIRSGLLDGEPRKIGEVSSARSRRVALEAASEAITLLKNDGNLLPLDASKLHTLAVIGPDADVPLYEGVSSASVIPDRIETPLMSLRRELGRRVKIVFARGADNDPRPAPVDARLLSPTRSHDAQGLAFDYYDNPTFSGRPFRSGVQSYFGLSVFDLAHRHLSARWDGYLWPPKSGKYEVNLVDLGKARLYVDRSEVLGPERGMAAAKGLPAGLTARTATLTLNSGRGYRIRIEYVGAPTPVHVLYFGLRLPKPSIQAAVEAARGADAAIVFVGDSRESGSEGNDRPGIDLYGRQNDLVRAVLAANPKTVVVLENGAPLALPWANAVPAIVEGWLDGIEGPDAIAGVILGEVDPSGRLAMTFPRRMSDTPGYAYYSDTRNANYGEGVFMGYRFYEKRDIEPLFPFGYGLSFTSFRYSNLTMPAAVSMERPFRVSLDISNTGARSGKETVQLYLGDAATTQVVRPIKELRGFRKVNLLPNETKRITFTIGPRDLSYYDVQDRCWASTPGLHRAFIGSSSRDIRLQQAFAVRGSLHCLSQK